MSEVLVMLPIGIKRPCAGPLTRDQAETCVQTHLDGQNFDVQMHGVRSHVRRVLRQISASGSGHATGTGSAEPRG
jgi:hypothetical protein